MERSQSFTDDLQRENGHSEIMDFRHSDNTGSQMDDVQYDPINETCSQSDDGNERGDQHDTINSNSSNSVCSHDNGITKLTDDTLVSSVGSQQMDSRSDAVDNTRSDTIDEPRGQLSPVDSVDAKGEGDDSNVRSTNQHEVASSQEEDDQSDLMENHHSCTANSSGENSESNITNSEGRNVAGSQDEKETANSLESNSPGSTNSAQKENDKSSNTSCLLLHGADSKEENETSDVLDDTQLCTANAQDHHVVHQEIAVPRYMERRYDTQLCTANAQDHHVVNQEIAVPRYMERRLNMAGQTDMQDLMLRMRPGKMDVTNTSVVGNDNIVIHGNPEEHSETLHAVETSTNRMTEEYEEQTTSVKEEIHESEGRLTQVIKDEGSLLAETVTYTGQDVSGRIDETKEDVQELRESLERTQGDIEFNIANVKDQNAALHREADENASYHAKQSKEAQKDAIEQYCNKTTEYFSKEIGKVKADVQDTKQAMLRAVAEQGTLMQNEKVTMTTMLTAMEQTEDGFCLLTKRINTANEDTKKAFDCLKGSLDSLRTNQGIILGQIQSLTEKMAELEENIKISNKKHNKRIDEVCSQIRNVKQKVGNTVDDTKDAIIGTVWKSVKRSERSILNAL